MAFGILEPATAGHVPGTVHLVDNVQSDIETSMLKHGKGKDSHFVLDPQPSEDPNDPLNWTSFEKHFILVILAVGAMVNGAAPGPILQAGVLPISQDLGVTFTQVTLLAGYVLLAAGSMGIFVSAFARKFGKRPLYIFCSLMSVIGCIIGQCAHSYSTLVVARVIQGLGVGAYESLVVASIGDLFFVHERGVRVAVVMFILATVTNGILIIAGPITANLGWHYNFHILLPFVVLQFIMVVLFVPETTYRRPMVFETDTINSDSIPDTTVKSHVDVVDEVAINKEQLHDNSMARSTTFSGRKTFTQRLSPYNGVFEEESILKMLFSSVVIVFNIAATYNILVSGITLAWFVGVSIITTVVFSSPPYLYSAASVGYTSVAPLLGGLLASIFMGTVSKRQMIWMVERNKGVYEPEYRLPLTVVGMLTAVGGIVGFGYAVRDVTSVYVICTCWGIMMFGLNVIVTTTAGFVLDAFKQYSTEIFVMNMLFKNFFFYGLTNYVIDWYVTQGPTKMFNIIGGITAACCLTTVPMYVWGKKYRYYWSQRPNRVW